jgi:hypothetical protein
LTTTPAIVQQLLPTEHREAETRCGMVSNFVDEKGSSIRGKTLGEKGMGRSNQLGGR